MFWTTLKFTVDASRPLLLLPPPWRHSGRLSSSYPHQKAKDCLRNDSQRAWNFWSPPSPRPITPDTPLMSLHVHKTQRMFSWVDPKTKRVKRVLLCSSDPSVRHVKFWVTEQVCDAVATSQQQKKQKYAKRSFEMSPCILALRANSQLGHILFLKYRPASSPEPTWNSVSAGLRCRQFSFLFCF